MYTCCQIYVYMLTDICVHTGLYAHICKHIYVHMQVIRIRYTHKRLAKVCTCSKYASGYFTSMPDFVKYARLSSHRLFEPQKTERLFHSRKISKKPATIPQSQPAALTATARH